MTTFVCKDSIRTLLLACVLLSLAACGGGGGGGSGNGNAAVTPPTGTNPDPDPDPDPNPDPDPAPPDPNPDPNPDPDVVVNTSDLPEFFSMSEDGSQLLRGKVLPDDFYEISRVENFYLYIDSSNWFDELETATNNEEYLSATVIFDGETLENVGVQFKGNTSYRNSEERKSFDIKLDYEIDGQDINGYNTLNFNNSFQDPTYMREVFYVNQSRRHMPAASGNFINLYVNDEFWGIYPNLQQLNKDHLKQWYLSDDGTNWRALRGGATGSGSAVDGGGGMGMGMGGGNFNDGTTALNYLGDTASVYESSYELKTTSSDTPYEYLVAATRSLDSVTEDNIEEVSEVFDIDGALWFIAHEIIFGDDDGYISKGAQDYYVHHDVVTGKLVPYEFDGNSVMVQRNAYDVLYRIDGIIFPIAYKLLNIPELRQRYLAHFRTILSESLDPTVAYPILDYYRTLIEDGVANDPHPHNGTSYAGFDDAIETVKDYIADRYALLENHTEVSLRGPTISDVSRSVGGAPTENPSSNESPTISATVLDNSYGVETVYAYYGTGVVGAFTRIELFDDGAHGDGSANDNVFANSIPAQDPGTYVRYYIEAISNDNAQNYGTISYLPVGAEHDVFVYRVALEVQEQTDFVINEIMASNSSSVVDEYGEYDDWAEFYNNSSEEIDLTGYYLSDDANNPTKWAFPSVTIGAGEYLILWLDEDGEQGENHVNFRLAANGEDLLLSDPEGTLINLVTFRNQETDMSFGRIPNATGDFQVLNPSFGEANL